jgi:hypothetical protein
VQILSHASSQTLCRVAACSKLLYSIATAAVLWQPLCEARSWGPFKQVIVTANSHAIDMSDERPDSCVQGQSWHQGFCIEYSKLCVECRRPTRYIFKLFGCRLCEKCEFEVRARPALCLWHHLHSCSCPAEHATSLPTIRL